ncbi:MAG: T9SS type A sorting domain-containing protein [Candidatus Marinimicrobia bacterium]|nr:T9SS type A sorting domain-containing protein [Candidatus Neomarinimicrobiota bacterium]
MKIFHQLINNIWVVLIISIGFGQTTGCMDDGYQQWSPNWGSPACNYDQFAIIEGECLYNDCNGECPVIFENEWLTNPDFTDKQFDDCGECGGDNSSCSDCHGIPNGAAYINSLCIDSDNNNGCVGGDTGISDCLKIDLSFGGYMESNSTDTIKVFITNLDTLQSIDIEFQFDNSIINIKEFSLVGIGLYNIGYVISYYSFIEASNFTNVNFTLYFEPHPNPETDHELFSPDGQENIFNIVIEAMDINADITTQLTINEFTINEKLMGDSNWEGGEILVVVPSGCTDELACNYDPNAREDDGSCEYEIDCTGECGGDAVYDDCDVCGGNDTDSDNCTCTEADSEFDCNGDCPPIEDCPTELSFIEGCAFKDPNCSNVCVGGATERYPCQQDCTGEWGGTAYEDNCEQCIADSNDIDCFNSSFNIYNSNGLEDDDFIIKELDTIYIALHMQNLPNPLEGIILDIDYNSSDLFLNNWSLTSEEFNLEGELNGELNNTNELYIDIDSTIIDSTIFTAVMYTTNELYEGNGGKMLFLQFINVGDNGASTYVNYKKVQINEHVMQEQNYTSQVIYFGDCYGVFNGDAFIDECGECVGGNTGIVDCDLSNNKYQLIPKDYHLNQNYPNPFNPTTYIHYSVPQYDFVTINIVNISGQIIKTIVQSSHQPGNYEIMWNGTNQNGISVPSGIYFYKMDADEFVSVRKLVLLK